MSIRRVVGAAVPFALVCFALAACGGGGGGIEGTVTIAGEPAAGVTVELLAGGSDDPTAAADSAAAASTTTDEQGRFTLDAAPGEYAVIAKDLEIEGTGGCNAMIPFLTVKEGSSANADFDVPAESPATGIDFVDPFWFVCFAP